MENNGNNVTTPEVKKLTPEQKEKLKEKERLAREKEKQKEKERLAREKEKQKEKERLAREKEKQKEKERLAREKEKQKEKERLAREKEKQKEKERLAKEKEKQKEKERLAKEKEKATSTPKAATADAKPKLELPKKRVVNLDDLSEEELAKIKENEAAESLQKMKAVLEARQKLNAGLLDSATPKEGKIKLGKLSLEDDDSSNDAPRPEKQASDIRKDEIAQKLKEAAAAIGVPVDENELEEPETATVSDLLEQLQELQENNDILNDALDRAETLEFDGIRVCNPDTFEMSEEFAQYIENLKARSNSEQVEKLEAEIAQLKEELAKLQSAQLQTLEADTSFTPVALVEEPVEIVTPIVEEVVEENKVTVEEVIEPSEEETSQSVDTDVPTEENTNDVVVTEPTDTVTPPSDNSEKRPSAFRTILDFFVKSLNGMAYGLFFTLIVGVIITQFASFLPAGNPFRELLETIANAAKSLVGVGIGVGVGWALKQDGLRLVAAAVAGGVVATIQQGSATAFVDPLSIYLIVIITIGFLKYCWFKKTPVDILLIPIITLLISGSLAQYISPYVAFVTTGIGNAINTATTLQPIPMGIIIAVVMGMCLTAPISSAAIAMTIHLSGIAAGAAVVGCCVQMLGFAVMSRKDNNIGKVISVAVGTSMLQFKNILKKPILWLPTILTSAILGPIATTVLHLECNDAGAGMGTSGLVGIFQTFNVMGYNNDSYLAVGVLLVGAPIILVFIFDVIFRAFKWIKPKDLEI